MASKYGDAAVTAAMNSTGDPRLEWKAAVKKLFPSKLHAQNKGCPRGAFLGLCEEGLISGIPRGKYTGSKDNKSYAIRAVKLLAGGDQSESPQALWRKVIGTATTAHNHQMDVVQALWKAGLIKLK